jgi:hypothetical protein
MDKLVELKNHLMFRDGIIGLWIQQKKVKWTGMHCETPYGALIMNENK